MEFCIFTNSIARTSVGKVDKKRMRAEHQEIYMKGSGGTSR
jgi:hypothetical protein